MTLEELLDYPEKIEALSDAELIEYFKDVLNITRPDIVLKEKGSNIAHATKKRDVTQTDEYKRRARLLAEQHGIKLPGF